MKTFREYRENERRFSVTVYVDVYVPETADIQADKMEAMNQARELMQNVPNSRIGEIGLMRRGSLSPDEV